MKTKRLIAAICGITLASVSIFNNVNINNINAVEDSEIGVIEEHINYSDGITYGTYDCGDCIIEYSVGTNRIVVRGVTQVEGSMYEFNELNIPAYINGIPVTIIKDDFTVGIFADYITSIVIPDTVTYIGDNAFSNCSRLFKINIPDSVTSIGKSAFASCSNLKEIKIPNSVKSIGNYAFSGCTSLESVELSNNVKELYGTFENCNNLKSVTIPESVIYIDNAFYNCRNLKSLIIPESVEAFSFDFGHCADEFSLTILSDNLYIRSLHDSGYYDMEFLFDSIHEGRMKIYAHENSTVYNVYKYACYNNYRDNQEEYEKALSKFNIIKNDTDINDDTQWYTVVKSADVNNDGKIDASDASDILNYYAYISTGGELSFEDFTALKE